MNDVTKRVGGLVWAVCLLLLAVAGCSDDDGTRAVEPVPTTVEITPASARLTFIRATQGFTAVVRDQDGKVMSSADVSWSSSDGEVFTVTGSGSGGTATAVGNGMAELMAVSGQASGTAAVEVRQRVARLEAVSGDDQQAVRGTKLAEPLVVRSRDQGGTPVAGVRVTFRPSPGHGSVSPGQVETGVDGTASTEWTLGLTGPRQSLVAFADQVNYRFTATATTGSPIPDLEFRAVTLSRDDPTVLETVDVMAEIVNLGDGATPPTFKLAVSVDGQVVGTVDVGQLAAGATGNAVVTVGPFPTGRHTLDLVLDPDGEFEEWETANNSASVEVVVVNQDRLAPGESVTVFSEEAGSVLLFRIDVEEASDEALNIVLSGGAGDADLFAHYGDRPGHTNDYRCNSGTFTTDESCQMVPTRIGAYHVAVLAFSSFGPSKLEVTVGGRPLEPFDIELVFLNSGTPSQDAIVEQAAVRWESVMGQEVQDYPAFVTDRPFARNQCFRGQPSVAEEIDDIRIWISIDSVDGVGKNIASAGPCHVRAISYGFGTFYSTPALGAVLLDEADVAQMESEGTLLSVVTHQLAHALGFGTIWRIREWIQDPSSPDKPDADTHFTGPLTIPAFDAVGGSGYAGARVPVENGGTRGVADTHWRESVFGDELMTPYLTGDTQPLSLVTIESMYDIWYEVDLDAADAFSLTSAGRAGMAMPRGPFIDLSDDVADWPIVVGDQKTGRVLGVIHPRRRR
ncbi:MAG: hypothetical protein F4139_06930 [Gemmatimonadetes bacterium]|nr:hypothetical protein [Gemmatimonadota bacterium]MYH52670.1 hypothetical protein [Gemmatimonadota bacterium]MYK65202.1 hypothetical protein [Gemmatimonadota bacterium]